MKRMILLFITHSLKKIYCKSFLNKRNNINIFHYHFDTNIIKLLKIKLVIELERLYFL